MMKRLKKYTLVNSSNENVTSLFPDEIIQINPAKCKDGTVGMLVTYYDDDICISSTVFCEQIIVENFK